MHLQLFVLTNKNGYQESTDRYCVPKHTNI
jgi:hypothetical protein